MIIANHAKITRAVRKLVGPGTTESNRGMTTLFFSRGKEAWDNAFEQLQKASEEPAEPGTHIIMFIIKGRRVYLKKFEANTNNFAEFAYMVPS